MAFNSVRIHLHRALTSNELAQLNNDLNIFPTPETKGTKPCIKVQEGQQMQVHDYIQKHFPSVLNPVSDKKK
jgi:hypothetical protein